MRFRVKAGKHQQDQQTYKKGDVVDSDHDLIAAFPSKFERVEDDAGGSAGPGLERTPVGVVPVGLRIHNPAEVEGAQPHGDSSQLVGTHVKDIDQTQTAQTKALDGLDQQTARISERAKANAPEDEDEEAADGEAAAKSTAGHVKEKKSSKKKKSRKWD